MKKIMTTALIGFVCTMANAQLAAGTWGLNGNSVGANAFLGTTNSYDLVFKRNNEEVARFKSRNISLGSSMPYYIGGVDNIAIGSLSSFISGSNNTVIGYGSASQIQYGASNTIIGAFSGMDLDNHANGNIIIGSGSGNGLTTGYGNVIIGSSVSSLSSNMSDHIILASGIGDIRMTINDTGKVLIGNPANTATPGDYKLYVEDGILTEKVRVALKTTSDWADHVFEDHYELMPLREVETFIKENRHLPGISSAETLVEEGIDLGAMQAKLLEKIEELTLYLIQKDKEIADLKQQMNILMERK